MNPMMGGGQPPQPAGAPSPVEGGNQQGMIKQKLLELLAQAEQVASKNGVDFHGVLMEFMEGKGMMGGKAERPKPPMSPPGASPMG